MRFHTNKRNRFINHRLISKIKSTTVRAARLLEYLFRRSPSLFVLPALSTVSSTSENDLIWSKRTERCWKRLANGIGKCLTWINSNALSFNHSSQGGCPPPFVDRLIFLFVYSNLPNRALASIARQRDDDRFNQSDVEINRRARRSFDFLFFSYLSHVLFPLLVAEFDAIQYD